MNNERAEFEVHTVDRGEEKKKNKLIKNDREWEWKHAKTHVIHDFCFWNLVIIKAKIHRHKQTNNNKYVIGKMNEH